VEVCGGRISLKKSHARGSKKSKGNRQTTVHCQPLHKRGKGISIRASHFTGDCQKWELAEIEKGFTQFLNLLVNNSLAMTMGIKSQISFFCPFIFQPTKMDFD